MRSQYTEEEVKALDELLTETSEEAATIIRSAITLSSHMVVCESEEHKLECHKGLMSLLADLSEVSRQGGWIEAEMNKERIFTAPAETLAKMRERIAKRNARIEELRQEYLAQQGEEEPAPPADPEVSEQSAAMDALANVPVPTTKQ